MEEEQDEMLINLKGSIATQSIDKLLDDIESTPTGPKRLKKRKGCVYEKGQAMYKIKTFSSSLDSKSQLSFSKEVHGLKMQEENKRRKKKDQVLVL